MDAAPGGDSAAADDEEVVIEELDPGTSGATDPVGAAVAAAAEEAERSAEGDEEDVADDGAGGEGDDKHDGSTDTQMAQIEKEKKDMSAEQKLERSLAWKAEGNEHFKKGDIFRAADSYYRAILYSRDLMQNPQYYPNLKHTPEQRKSAQELCESVFTNLALVQTKYGATLQLGDPERVKVLEEGAKSASEALKINAKNVKALYRRALARVSLAEGAKNAEAQRLLGEAKQDLLAVVAEDANNRDARSELKTVQERLKELKREEVANEKREFSFANTLGALSAKEKDLLGDGSVRKRQVSAGDGGKWVNEDWLAPDAPTRCVVHATCAMVSTGGPEGKDVACGTAPVTLSFVLGEPDMHEGLHVAIRSMTVGEVASFTMAPVRLAAQSSLAKLLPDPQGVTSVWEITFLKFVTWADLDRNGERLQKIQDEGYGKFPEPLAEVFMHWRVFGADGGLLHSSRYTINVGAEGKGGIQQVEDEDKAAPCYVLGESCWEPLALLCKSLRQGGVGELRMRKLPPLPKQEGSGADGNVSAQLSMMLNKAKGTQDLRHCTVRAELERVVQPIAGPEDPRWEGLPALVQERFRAEQLRERGEEAAALARLRRVAAWCGQLPPEQAAAAAGELAAARAAIGWILAARAAPVLDLGNVSSDVLKAARQDLAEAEGHCAWLEEHHKELPGTLLLRAKILVAQDDDFEGAHRQLLQAQRVAPDDKLVQEELRKVKVELRKLEEEKSRAKVVELRDGLKRARTEEPEGPKREEAVVGLLQELGQTPCSWETVMETRIGVELKSCQEGCGDTAKRLCGEILARLKDQSKEQRPMWDA